MADDGGLSPGDLAEQRGISKDEGRRLVKAGKVPAHQTSGIHGLTWCVHPDGDMPERNGGASPAPGLHQGSATPAQPADVAALVGLVDRLTAENRELVNAVDAWQSQAVVLAGRLVDAEERLALTAPSTPVEAPTTAEHAQTAPGRLRATGGAAGARGWPPAWLSWCSERPVVRRQASRQDGRISVRPLSSP